MCVINTKLINITFCFLRMDEKQSRCVLWNRKAPPDERRPASTFLVILRKHFSLNVEETDVLCNKCRHKCRKVKDSVTRESMFPRIAPQEETEDPTFASPKQKRPKHAFPSPPSVPLPFPSSPQSHGYCFVCKKPGPKLVTVSHHVRLLVFIRREIIIPSGARCCVQHRENGWCRYAADQDQWKHNAQQNIHPQSHKGINNLHEIKIHNNVKLK